MTQSRQLQSSSWYHHLFSPPYKILFMKNFIKWRNFPYPKKFSYAEYWMSEKIEDQILEISRVCRSGSRLSFLDWIVGRHQPRVILFFIIFWEQAWHLTHKLAIEVGRVKLITVTFDKLCCFCHSQLSVVKVTPLL